MNRELLGQVGSVTVDYRNGPLRKGFQITTGSQTGQGCSSGCSC